MEICLGIESTAHTFGVSIIKGRTILSNIKKSFTTKSGGMVPFEVATHHVDNCDGIIKEALSVAGVSAKDLTLIAFSQSPGLGPMLRVGAMCARSLSQFLNIPLVGVNHCIAHLEIGRLLTSAKDPILLYASGANTQVIAFEGGKYRVFGETLDIGIGNFLDQFARYVGLGFPGGPKIGMLAKEYKDTCLKENKEVEYIKLPYSVKGMDMSFGGMLTFLKKKFDEGESLSKLCFSLEETAYAMLCEVSERALAHCDKKELLLGGGVACASRLQDMAKKMCQDRDASCYILENQFNVDNAAMIAWLGILEFTSGYKTFLEQSAIDPYLRTDDVDVFWR